ncbi:hypothetical protein FN846DRAFT_973146 [Sphaerosporella brunnea]|uniref:Nuclear pore complex component-domain-containing protein n=1 Tax=Sphaerosporella brunnea TaxID=1250544 RepID=A0A5J5EIC8_9PEZI|nr:hypothetical protein FN846DRAFT_973146 [Sphaerosporella brunnea]
MFPATLLTYAGYAFWLARLVFVWNIGLELYKAVKPLDDFSDLDLTLDQRKLLGLPDTPVTASKEQEIFETPPRYSKTTPPSRTSSPLASASSPLASTSSPTMQRKAALGSNRSDLGLSSLGIDTPSPLSTPLRNGLRPLFESPRSPKNVGGASSITPSHRWAYEKSILSRKSKPPPTNQVPISPCDADSAIVADPTSGGLSPSKSIFSPR